MAGIVCTALSYPSAGPAATKLWVLPTADRWRLFSLVLYCVGTGATLGAVFLGWLSFAHSAGVAICLGTLCTLCAKGSFGGASRMAGKRLRAPEFLLQYFWILWVMAFIFSDTAASVRLGCSKHRNCAGRLSKGSGLLRVAFGLDFVDRSDDQWSFFREQLPLLCGVAAVFLALSASLRSVRARGSAMPSFGLYCLAGAVFLVVVHGSGGALFFALAAATNYMLARWSAAFPLGWVVPWVFAVGFMCTGEWYGNEVYKWKIWLPEPYGAQLDSLWGGMAPRWWVYAGVSLLRMIAFSFDYRWATRAQLSRSRHRDSRDTDEPLSYRRRCEESPELAAFSFAAYFAYVFYLPTLLAGPILPFNAFYSQVVRPQRTHSLRKQLDSPNLHPYSFRVRLGCTTLTCMRGCISCYRKVRRLASRLPGCYGAADTRCSSNGCGCERCLLRVYSSAADDVLLCLAQADVA